MVMSKAKVAALLLFVALGVSAVALLVVAFSGPRTCPEGHKPIVRRNGKTIWEGQPTRREQVERFLSDMTSTYYECSVCGYRYLPKQSTWWKWSKNCDDFNPPLPTFAILKGLEPGISYRRYFSKGRIIKDVVMLYGLDSSFSGKQLEEAFKKNDVLDFKFDRTCLQYPGLPHQGFHLSLDETGWPVMIEIQYP
jgi:hypothetical protein